MNVGNIDLSLAPRPFHLQLDHPFTGQHTVPGLLVQLSDRRTARARQGKQTNGCHDETRHDGMSLHWLDHSYGVILRRGTSYNAIRARVYEKMPINAKVDVDRRPDVNVFVSGCQSDSNKKPG